MIVARRSNEDDRILIFSTEENLNLFEKYTKWFVNGILTKKEPTLLY